MIKTFLMHTILDQCINTAFDTLRKNFPNMKKTGLRDKFIQMHIEYGLSLLDQTGDDALVDEFNNYVECIQDYENHIHSDKKLVNEYRKRIETMVYSFNRYGNSLSVFTNLRAESPRL